LLDRAAQIVLNELAVAVGVAEQLILERGHLVAQLAGLDLQGAVLLVGRVRFNLELRRSGLRLGPVPARSCPVAVAGLLLRLEGGDRCCGLRLRVVFLIVGVVGQSAYSVVVAVVFVVVVPPLEVGRAAAPLLAVIGAVVENSVAAAVDVWIAFSARATSTRSPCRRRW
jgi:hypothetical protein